MIVHITMSKYKETARGRSKEENIQHAKSLIEALNGRIPDLHKVEVGINMLHLPNDYDVVVILEYNSLDALQATYNYPLHDEMVVFLQKVVATRHAVTYEVER